MLGLAGGRRHAHGRQILALQDTVHSQEREYADFDINRGLLVGTQSSLRPSYSVTQEKARGSANGHLINQDDGIAGKTRPVLTLYAFSSIFVYTNFDSSSP